MIRNFFLTLILLLLLAIGSWQAWGRGMHMRMHMHMGSSVAADSILMESTGYILLETGETILLE